MFCKDCQHLTRRYCDKNVWGKTGEPETGIILNCPYFTKKQSKRGKKKGRK